MPSSSPANTPANPAVTIRPVAQLHLLGTHSEVHCEQSEGAPNPVPETTDLVKMLEVSRVVATGELNQRTRGKLGQFMSPAAVAMLMSEMLDDFGSEVRILDPGAGTGSLSVAAVMRAVQSTPRPSRIEVVAYEVSEVLAGHLKTNLEAARGYAYANGVELNWEVRIADFIAHGAELLDAGDAGKFTHVITNPPYRKINSKSPERALLRRIGLETSNLYTGFAALAVLLAAPGARFVMITPRSFANGPYFRPFREFFLDRVALRRIHIFEKRNLAFADDDVLQENVIVAAVVGRQLDVSAQITLSQSSGHPDETPTHRPVPYGRVVVPDDQNRFLRLELDDAAYRVAEAMRSLPCTLEDLGLKVSTGRVVDFRAREALRPDPEDDTVPLIYPCHMHAGGITWPVVGKKPNALVRDKTTASLLVPAGTYVLIKRFTSKEEPRRIVASICGDIDGAAQLAFENHLNYFHMKGHGIEPVLARGLALYLNSTFADQAFRMWSGHTQVNATDLRVFRYPSLTTLDAMGRTYRTKMPNQERVDAVLDELVLTR